MKNLYVPLLLFGSAVHGLHAQAPVQLTNLPTLYITTTQAVQDKENWVKGSLQIAASAGTPGMYSGDIDIRGRGNSTWTMNKKPYRIRLAQKHQLLGMPANERNWVLLANYADKTLMRNALAFEISKFLGLPYSCPYRLVDVYMNGSYIGNYTLTDHIQVADKRVETESIKRTDSSGEALTGGYLLEADGFAEFEQSWFQTNRGVKVTIKHPDEEDIVVAQRNYIISHVQGMEDALYAENFKDPVNGYAKYIDQPSLINWFLGCELTANTDAYWSTYFFKRRSNDKLYFGPLWDFDIAFNNDRRIGNSQYHWLVDSGMPPTTWIRRFLEDDQLNAAIRQRWNQVKTAGLKQRLLYVVDSLATALDQSQQKNFQRWNILNTVVYQEHEARGSYANEVAYLKNFISTRFDWMDQELNGPNTNQFYKIENSQTQKALSVLNSTQNVLNPYTAELSQQWKFVNLGNGFFRIVNRGTGKVLQAPTGNTGSLLMADEDPINLRQQWRITNTGNNRLSFINRQSKYAITNRNGSNANNNPVDLAATNLNNPIDIHGITLYTNASQHWVITQTGSVDEVLACTFTVSASASNPTPAANASITLTSGCTGSDCEGVSYAWSGHGFTASGSSATLATPSAAGTYTYAVVASKANCPSQSSTVTIQVSNTPTSTQGCSDIPNKCSGNSHETVSVSYTVATAGSYDLTVGIRAHEGDAYIRYQVNGGTWLTAFVPRTGPNEFRSTNVAKVNLVAGNNIIAIGSGGSYMCFNRMCISGNAAPQPTCNFAVSASASTTSPAPGASVSLSAACNGGDCGGVAYAWSGHGFSASGSSASLTAPTAPGSYTYTVTASKNGCSNQTSTVTLTVSQTQTAPQLCIEQSKCSGNMFETAAYNFNVPGGSYELKVNYSTHESDNYIRYQINGGAWKSAFAARTSFNEYRTLNLGTVSLNSGLNTITISTGGTYLCFNKVCIGNLTSQPPQPTCNFAVSASASTTSPAPGASVSLSATCNGGDCGGVAYAWSGHGFSASGSSASLTAPTAPGTYTYTVTASKNGCSNQTSTVTLTVSQASVSGQLCIDQNKCSGNMYETAAYNFNVPGGSYELKVNYSTHEGDNYIRYQINGGAWKSAFVARTSFNEYRTINLGMVSLNSATNVITISTGGTYLCFNKVCISPSVSNLMLVDSEPESVEQQPLVVGPNPNSGAFTVSFSVDTDEPVSLQIVDVVGRNWYEQRFTQKGLTKEKIQLPESVSGPLFIRLQRPTKTEIRKIIIIR